MKLSLSNLKTADYKQLLIDHGEKVVIAVVGLLIAGVLYGANWKATDKTPTQLTELADKAKQQIDQRPWPEKQEKEKAGLGQGNDLAGKVAQMLTPVSASVYGISPLNPPLHPDKTLISMPRWLPVQNLIADSGVAEISLKPGSPPLDDGGFIRKTPKEKEPKSKARDRAKRREANQPKKEEKKEENDDSIPEDSNPRSLSAEVAWACSRWGESATDKKGWRPGTKESEETVQPAVTVAVKPVGRGYRFVAVRGIFPLADQISELARVTGWPSNQKELQRFVQFHDFKLERQTRVDD